MMNININIFKLILIFYIFGNFIILINCQLTPISINENLIIKELNNNNDQVYLNYPSSSIKTICTPNLQFIVQDNSINKLNSDISIDAFSVGNSTQHDIFTSNIYKENGYLVFSVTSYSMNSNETNPISIYYINLIATSNYSISVEYQIKYQCLYPDTSNASIYFLPDFATSMIVNDGIYAGIKVDGLNFNLLYMTSPVGRMECWGDNLFLLYLAYSQIGFYFTNVIQITIPLWNKSFNLTIDNPLYSNEIVKIDEIITYPNNITNDVIQFGTGFTPILQFRTNSTLDLPLQFNNLNQLLPLYGSRGNITYICKLIDGYQSFNTPFTNSIFYNNAGKYDILKFNIISTRLYPFELPNIQISYNNETGVVELPMFLHSFIISPNYYNVYLFQLSGYNFYKGLPFGRVYGNNLNSTHQVAFQINQFSVNIEKYSISPLPLQSESTSVDVKFNENDKVPQIPQLLSYKFTHIIGTTYLLRIQVYDMVGLDCIRFISSLGINIDTSCRNIGLTLVEGDRFNGTHEFVVDIGIGIILILINSFNVEVQIIHGSYISYNPVYQFLSPMDYNVAQMQVDSILDITFLYNNLSLIDNSSYNIVYIKPNLLKISKSQGMKFMIRDHQSMDISTGYLSSWNAVWDDSLNMFIAKFILPKGSIYGNIQYAIRIDTRTLALNLFYPLHSQLIVNSTYYYNVGPYFSNIIKLPSDSVEIKESGSTLVGWRITIKEDYYGFNKGYIKVIGSIDNSIYHFNFTLADALPSSSSDYNILINITSPCLSQDYLIEVVELQGKTGIKSSFSITDLIPEPTRNPFKLFLSDININKINTICLNQVPNDTTPPKLIDFKVNTNLIDVSSDNRLVIFNFTANDNETGLKNDQLPIIYLISKRMEIIECISKIDSINGYSTTYSCSINLPFGFAYPGSIIISVYGFFNNGGYSSGFSSFDLQLSSFQYYINTTLISRLPYLKSNEAYLSDGSGDLVLYGYNLDNTQSLLFNLSSGYTFSLSPNSIFSTVLIIKNFIKVSNPFTVKVVSKNNLIHSNIHIVYPIYYNFNSTDPEPEPEPTPTPTPTSTNLHCPGIKLNGEPCGGIKNGYCSNNGQCICYSPWFGPTCTSQIIIVPQPSTNTSEPTIEIPTTNNGNDTNNDESSLIFFKSLISIVSLRELDYNDNLVKEFKFDKWIYTNINDYTNLYYANITSSVSVSLTTNITVKLEWFKNETEINFAGYNLIMNPSTIKYTIEIGEYQFNSKLNKLQLIMSALFSASKSSDICSSKEFGLSLNGDSGDDSNYLKIQIDNHSLYGRFIKRAVIDGNPKIINNVLLDSSLNILSDNHQDTASSVQSFIGITIPFYNENCIIDPDFSVLIDSYTPIQNNNTICNLSKNGLSTAQLAGIIVGSVGFATVIVVSICYAIYQHRKSKIFISKLSNSMK